MLNERRFKIIAMDMDGTITQHKSKLEGQNRLALTHLMKRYQLVIVGAGSCGRIAGQLELDGVDMIGNYGMQLMMLDKASGRPALVRDVKAPVNREEIIAKVSRFREIYGYRSYLGETVEFHQSGAITLPLLGTKAPLADKLAFDPEKAVRRKIYGEVTEIFPEYNVFIGGTSSFDMAPRPYDKLTALRDYIAAAGVSAGETLYIGDDYGEGGNDACIFGSEITSWGIDNYLDFPNLLGPLLTGGDGADTA